jgi:hypothetical protein
MGRSFQLSIEQYPSQFYSILAVCLFSLKRFQTLLYTSGYKTHNINTILDDEKKVHTPFTNLYVEKYRDI